MKKLFLVKKCDNVNHEIFDKKMENEGKTYDEKIKSMETKGVQKWVSFKILKGIKNKKLK